MFWIKLLKMIFIIICAAIGCRAGYMTDTSFKGLKWYDKIFRIYWIMCGIVVVVVLMIALWRSL